MKRYLLSLVALLLFAGAYQAYAGMNLRQNRDGTADWLNSQQNVSSVGAVYLSLMIDDISTATTGMFVSPITDAILERVQVVLWGQPTVADAEILVTIGNAAAALCDGCGQGVGLTVPRRISVLYPISPSILYPVTFLISFSTATTGSVFESSPILMIQTTGFSNRTGTTVGTNATRIVIERGTTIYVATDGGSTTAITATVIITLRPRG